MAIFGGFGVAALSLIVAKYIGAAKSKKHIVAALDKLKNYVEGADMNAERKKFVLNRIKSFEDFVPDQENLDEYKRFAESIIEDISAYLDKQFQEVEKVASDVVESIDKGFDSLANWLVSNFSFEEDSSEKETKTDEKKGTKEDT